MTSFKVVSEFVGSLEGRELIAHLETGRALVFGDQG